METEYTEGSAGVVEPAGFRAGWAAAGIRGDGSDRPDVGVLLSDRPAALAAVFTSNDIVAAPVEQGREVLRLGRRVRGIVANSGNANACTGEEGRGDCTAMAREIAGAVDGEPGEFLVASTGRIGRPLPMAVVREGIRAAAADPEASREAGEGFARAILTSDTRTKTVTATVREAGEVLFRVGGAAKGAGMIEPGMATMLAFLTTDLGLPARALQEHLRAAVDASFNRITVDGDMSTNDSVFLLANGVAGPGEGEGRVGSFAEALAGCCQRLAAMIVGDGERVEHRIELCVRGARSTGAAEKVARSIAHSLLVKSSWYGEDPNWGRLLSAAGAARTGIRLEDLDLFYGEVPVVRAGRPLEENAGAWRREVARPEFRITLSLGQGEATFRMLASDLTPGYVDFNKSE